MRAAIAAIAYEHPKLAVTAVVPVEGFADRLEAALARSAKVLELRPAPQIEPQRMRRR
jgi:hypothetical protein